MKIQARFIRHSEAPVITLEAARRALNAAELHVKAELRAARRRLAQRLRSRKATMRRQLEEVARRDLNCALVRKLAEFQRTFDCNIVELKRDCMNLSLEIASAVIDATVTALPEILIHRIQTTLDQFAERSVLRISVATSAEQKVSEKFGDQLRGKIAGDPQIPEGCACIDTVAGRVMIDWRRDLECITAELMQQVSKEVPRAGS